MDRMWLLYNTAEHNDPLLKYKFSTQLRDFTEHKHQGRDDAFVFKEGDSYGAIMFSSN